MSKGEQASEAILNAAEALFLKQGYNGTSMRIIAKAVGYRSVAGLYNHFSDKEQLFIALLEARSPYDHIFTAVTSLEGSSAEAFIPIVFETMIAQMEKNMNFLRLVLIDFLEFNGAHVRDMLDRMQTHMTRFFMRMAQFDDLKTDLPPAALVRIMGMQLFGYVITRGLLPPQILNVMTDAEWQEHMMQAVMYGVIKRDEK
ncbi:MAG TPA: helix-turn-helix domain-containing protein [Aggregatilineales bacterium]|nr:helix-turn-helix domain-containing protein [Aggregatilineales bacterium]